MGLSGFFSATWGDWEKRIEKGVGARNGGKWLKTFWLERFLDGGMGRVEARKALFYEVREKYTLCC